MQLIYALEKLFSFFDYVKCVLRVNVVIRLAKVPSLMSTLTHLLTSFPFSPSSQKCNNFHERSLVIIQVVLFHLHHHAFNSSSRL